MVHNCPYPVWCAVVVGYEPTDKTPLDQRPPVNWIAQPAGQVLTSYFADHPENTGMALMCTREPTSDTSSAPTVTQLEYTWRPDLSQTFFDVSNVAGDPFVNEGFVMTVNDPKTPLLNTCYGAHCAAGDANCSQVSEKSDDDFQGMRTCSDAVVIRLTLCSA